MDGRVTGKREGCREGCREPGGLQGDGKDARGELCPSGGASAEGFPHPAAGCSGGSDTQGAPSMEPEAGAPGKSEPGAAGDRGQGRGGWVCEELDKTKPSWREQVNPAVLPPPQ